jgi:hypothetical protein
MVSLLVLMFFTRIFFHSNIFQFHLFMCYVICSQKHTNQGWATLFDPLDEKGLTAKPNSSAEGLDETVIDQVNVDMDKYLDKEEEEEALDPKRHRVW